VSPVARLVNRGLAAIAYESVGAGGKREVGKVRIKESGREALRGVGG